MSEEGRSNNGDNNQDIGKMIQSELARCFGNLINKGVGPSNTSTDVNMVH